MSIFGKVKDRVYRSLLRFYDWRNDDERYLKVMFHHRLGYWPDLKSPKTFNEKLQWLKLHDHNPKYSLYADKYAVREHIRETIGEEYLIPLLGVYRSASEIDFNALPEQFVLKCNHGASYNIICTDKSKLDFDDARKKLDRWLSMDFYQEKKEYHYRNIEKRIVCEQYMKDDRTDELNDYKLFCIGGKVRMIQVDFDRRTNHRRNLYDTDWNLLDVQISFPRAPELHKEPPAALREMIAIAERLSVEFPQVRIDLYCINGKVYFGEMTFFSGAGFSKYDPASFERRLGDLLELPQER